ncbi:MAG: hypothetical protein FGM33_05320 [Candidatus Kapabacteria bacterium]|nr:hypothetical protein [Candidatus Kapabacteria bacterium]
MRIFAILAIVGAVVFSSTDTFAQGSLTPAAQAPVVLKPKLKLAYIKGAANFMGGIEIRGNEVDAYLDVRKVLSDAIDDATKAKKTDDDVITVEMRADQIQNLAVLMQRGTLKGSEADAFKDIMTALNESVKAAQASGK